MKQHSRAWILILAAVALGASLMSLYVHYRLLADPTYTSFCDVSATVSCEAVYQSAYGTVAGVPVAAGGAIWAALVLLLAVAMPGRQTPRDAGLTGYVFVLATIGLAAVLYYGYASFFVLNKLCLLCLTMYVTVIGIFIVSGATAAPMATLPERLSGDLKSLRSSPLAIALALVWLVASVSVVAVFPREGVAAPTMAGAALPAVPVETLSADEIAAFDQWMGAQPRETVSVDGGGARVVIVKFNDYQCPACRQTYLLYKGIEDKYAASHPDDVTFISLDFPLESECNTANIHPSACEAAAAVRMAKAKGRGNEMVEWLFNNQPTLTPDGVKAAVRDVGQVTDFDAQYAKTLEAIRADAQMGQRLNISGTPTFFINGIRIGATLRPAYFDAAIAYELKRTAASPATPDSMDAIRTDALTKYFSVGFWRPRPYRALDSLTLTVGQGEVFGFLGPNGAGKTTTLKLLMELIYPTSGHAEILGRPVGDVATRRRIGYLPENPYFYDYLTAEELLQYFAGLFGYGPADRRRRASALLDEVGIGPERRLQLRKFSKGMIQRVGIAQALINDPEVVFFDEPMSGLDPLGRREIRHLILRLREQGRTVFFSSHVLADAEALCSRVAIVVAGRLVASGQLSELLDLRMHGWELVLSGLTREALDRCPTAFTKVTELGADRYLLEVPLSSPPEQILPALVAGGATLVSMNPLRATLEDLFVEQVSAADKNRGLPRSMPA